MKKETGTLKGPGQAAELEKSLREVWDDPLHADMFPGGFDAKLSAD